MGVLLGAGPSEFIAELPDDGLSSEVQEAHENLKTTPGKVSDLGTYFSTNSLTALRGLTNSWSISNADQKDRQGHCSHNRG
jgi:hypothetical protein